MKKLSTLDTCKVIKALGGPAQVRRLLANRVTLPAISYWKTHGMTVSNADSLKLRSPRNPIWKEVDY